MVRGSATDWFGLAMYWVVLSRAVSPIDAEDRPDGIGCLALIKPELSGEPRNPHARPLAVGPVCLPGLQRGATEIISPEQWERMSRAERIACCHGQVAAAEEAAETAPQGRKEHYLEIAEHWRSLAGVLGRS